MLVAGISSVKKTFHFGSMKDPVTVRTRMGHLINQSESLKTELDSVRKVCSMASRQMEKSTIENGLCILKALVVSTALSASYCRSPNQHYRLMALMIGKSSCD